MIRTRTIPLPEGVTLMLAAEGGDIVLLADPDAILMLDMQDRYDLYNEVFSSVDGMFAVAAEQVSLQPAVAAVLHLDRLRRAV